MFVIIIHCRILDSRQCTHVSVEYAPETFKRITVKFYCKQHVIFTDCSFSAPFIQVCIITCLYINIALTFIQRDTCSLHRNKARVGLFYYNPIARSFFLEIYPSVILRVNSWNIAFFFQKLFYSIAEFQFTCCGRLC